MYSHNSNDSNCPTHKMPCTMLSNLDRILSDLVASHCNDCIASIWFALRFWSVHAESTVVNWLFWWGYDLRIENVDGNYDSWYNPIQRNAISGRHTQRILQNSICFKRFPNLFCSCVANSINQIRRFLLINFFSGMNQVKFTLFSGFVLIFIQ